MKKLVIASLTLLFSMAAVAPAAALPKLQPKKSPAWLKSKARKEMKLLDCVIMSSADAAVREVTAPSQTLSLRGPFSERSAGFVVFRFGRDRGIEWESPQKAAPCLGKTRI